VDGKYRDRVLPWSNVALCAWKDYQE